MNRAKTKVSLELIKEILCLPETTSILGCEGGSDQVTLILEDKVLFPESEDMQRAEMINICHTDSFTLHGGSYESPVILRRRIEFGGYTVYPEYEYKPPNTLSQTEWQKMIFAFYLEHNRPPGNWDKQEMVRKWEDEQANDI